MTSWRSLSAEELAKKKDDLMNVSNMHQVEGHKKYLGIPTITRRSKKVVLKALLDII